MEKIIDAHIHVGKEEFISKDVKEKLIKWPLFNYLWDNPIESFTDVLKRKNISKAIIFPIPISSAWVDCYDGEDTRTANNYIIDAYNTNKEKFIPFGLIPENPHDLEDLIKKGIKGFKEHSVGQRIHTIKDDNTAKMDGSYEVLNESGLPLLIHPAPIDKTLRIKKMFDKYPSLKIILAHCGHKYGNFLKEEEETLEVVENLKGYENLYFETSNIQTSGLLDEIYSLVGDKMVFGSDYPFGQINRRTDEIIDVYKKERETIDAMNIPKEGKEGVFYKNISKILKL